MESDLPIPREPDHAPAAIAGVTASLASRRASRRRVLRWAFWCGVGTALAGAGASVLNFVYPRSVEAFGGPVAVPPTLVPKPGDPPLRIADAHCLLVNLHPDEARIGGDTSETPGGLLALWWKCPHLGCTVPWDGSYVAPTDEEHRRGWFHCPCHGSTYTKAGVRVFGPAPRSMDTMRIEVGADGGITVQSGQRRDGGLDNPQRAIAYGTARTAGQGASGVRAGDDARPRRERT